MKIKSRAIDVEVTNRCNATCDFCPRENTPKQGFMTRKVFEQVIKRTLELNLTGNDLTLSITGRGEPTLHPEIVDFVHLLAENEIEPAITTNGSRLTPELSEQLLNAGLKKICLSVSDLGENYNKIYGLDFNDVMPRIDDFIQRARNRCFIQATVVRHHGNENEVDATIKFWESKNIDRVFVVQEENRAGIKDSLFQFQKGTEHRQQAIDLLHKKGLSDICSSPFFSVFFGWNGTYDLCCQDWEKTVNLGNIFDQSIEEVDIKKLAYVERHQGVCKNCSLNPINDVRELLYEIEQGDRGPYAIATKIKNLNEGRQRQKDMLEVLDKTGYQSKLLTIEIPS